MKIDLHSKTVKFKLTKKTGIHLVQMLIGTLKIKWTNISCELSLSPLLLKNDVCQSKRQLLVSPCVWTNLDTLDSTADGPALTHWRSAQPAAWLPAVAIYHSALPISLPLPLWDSEHVIWSQQATSQAKTYTPHPAAAVLQATQFAFQPRDLLPFLQVS